MEEGGAIRCLVENEMSNFGLLTNIEGLLIWIIVGLVIALAAVLYMVWENER